jgi:hypothetical protein
MAGVKLYLVGNVEKSSFPYTEYEDSCLLEYDVVSFGKELQTFRRSLL